MEIRHEHGFTLIELLIVVAIIAILAAIAVPNFLEAQTRSKTSRVLADMRTISVAMEVYRVDYNQYPVPWAYSYRVHPSGPVQQGAGPYSFSGSDNYLLTTPIAYVTSVPFDVFRLAAGQDFPIFPLYSVNRGTQNASYQPPFNSWMTWSRGPDRAEETGGYRPELAVIRNEKANLSIGAIRAALNGTRYDPTNGTVSLGDIYYWGPGAREDFYGF